MFSKSCYFISVTLLLSFIVVQWASAQILEKEIPVSVQGRIDHFSIDLPGQRLFVSALGNDSVEVIDLRRGEQIHSILGLKEPQGLLYAPNTNRLFVASDGDGTVRSYDGKSFVPSKTVGVGDDADNVRYDAQTNHLIVGYGDGGLITFDTNLQIISDVKLPVHPEAFQLARKSPFTFVNLPNDSSIAVIDRATNKAIGKWRVTAAAANFPMALDEDDERLFVGCRSPARLLVLDTGSGKLITELPTVGDTDDLFYDAARKKLYVIGGDGHLDVFEQKDADHYKPALRIKTAPGARTGFFAPTLNRIFVAAPRHGPNEARILVYRVD